MRAILNTLALAAFGVGTIPLSYLSIYEPPVSFREFSSSDAMVVSLVAISVLFFISRVLKWVRLLVLFALLCIAAAGAQVWLAG